MGRVCVQHNGDKHAARDRKAHGFLHWHRVPRSSDPANLATKRKALRATQWAAELFGEPRKQTLWAVLVLTTVQTNDVYFVDTLQTYTTNH